MVNTNDSDSEFTGFYCRLRVGRTTSWRYWRSHEVAADRGLVGFTVFIVWMLSWGYLGYVNAVVLRGNPLWRERVFPNALRAARARRCDPAFRKGNRSALRFRRATE